MRFIQLESKCRMLYMAGVLDYQGWSFTQILEAERKAGRMRSQHTLDKHLEHLKAHDFLVKKPGHRGKYFFTELSEVVERVGKLKKGIVDERYHWVQFLSAPSAKRDAAKADELATKLRLVHLDHGLEFASLLKGLSRLTRRRDKVRYVDIETDLLKVDLAMISLILARNYRDVMSDGVRIFREGLIHEKVKP